MVFNNGEFKPTEKSDYNTEFKKEKKAEYAEVYERINRHVEVGKLANRFNKVQTLIDLKQGKLNEFQADDLRADLSLKENPQIAIDDLMSSIYQNENKEAYYTSLSFLEHRGKAALFNKVKNGDTIVAFMVPSGNFFSIKSLNDDYLDPQMTDMLIVKRKELLNELFSEKLQVLEQEFKQSFFLVKEGVDINNPDFGTWMEEQSQALEQAINEYLLGLLQKQKSLCLAQGNFKKVQSLDSLIDKLNTALAFEDQLQKLNQDNSYHITYGMEKVEADDQSNLAPALILAEFKAIQSAQQNRWNQEAYGGKFKHENIKENLARIEEVRAELLKINKIEIPGELSYFLFQSSIDEVSGLEYYQLNKDVWTDLRKGKFKNYNLSVEGSRVLSLLGQYKDLINSIDYFKPFVAEEVADDGLINQMKERQTIANKIKNKEKLNETEFAVINKILNKDLKDDKFSSRAVFHNEALQIPNCSYVRLDVLGLGSDLLGEYEKKLALLAKSDESQWDDIFLQIGDEITQTMRKVREVSLDVLAKHGIENPLADVSGGDELMFAIDNSLVTDELLIELKEKTNSRVVKTVVAEAVKHLEKPENDEELLLIHHIIALGQCDSATNKVKAAEEQYKRLKNMVQYSNASSVDYTDQLALKESINYTSAKLDSFFLNPALPLPDFKTMVLRQNNEGEFVLGYRSREKTGECEKVSADFFLDYFNEILNVQKERWFQHLNDYNNK